MDKTARKVEDGMYSSDRCQFCGDFGEKVEPYLCPKCAEKIRKLSYHKPLLDKEAQEKIAKTLYFLRTSTPQKPEGNDWNKCKNKRLWIRNAGDMIRYIQELGYCKLPISAVIDWLESRRAQTEPPNAVYVLPLSDISELREGRIPKPRKGIVFGLPKGEPLTEHEIKHMEIALKDHYKDEWCAVCDSIARKLRFSPSLKGTEQ